MWRLYCQNLMNLRLPCSFQIHDWQRTYLLTVLGRCSEGRFSERWRVREWTKVNYPSKNWHAGLAVLSRLHSPSLLLVCTAWCVKEELSGNLFKVNISSAASAFWPFHTNFPLTLTKLGIHLRVCVGMFLS